jgi:hypothetical protein
MENTATRKINRAVSYDYSQNGACFITVCTHEKQKTLSYIKAVGEDIILPLRLLFYVLNLPLNLVQQL